MDMNQDHIKPGDPYGQDPGPAGAEAPDDQKPLSQWELACIVREIEQQPYWRAKADKEMDYLDGNQLDTDLLRKQAALGIPPAVENIMAETVEGIIGMEAKTRTDWRLTPDGGEGGEDVAAALNYELNQAERNSRADKACTDAFKPQLCVGLGWVEVSRESDPTKFPYATRAVNRNEVWWDMSESDDPRLLRNRWLLRKRWIDPKRLALVFPKKKEMILTLGRGGDMSPWGLTFGFTEGGQSTGLSDGSRDSRGWTIQEQQWYDPETRNVCLFEVWYRRWVSVPFIRLPGGRVVEYDQENPAHLMGVTRGLVKPQWCTIARMRRAYWMGPYQLHDGFSPYSHPYFPYVPFWGHIEDATGVPYGCLRGMMYSQDTLNSGIAKLRWGMSAVRTERTKGALADGMTDAQFRLMVARVDADIVLDPAAMRPEAGGIFKVERDYQLTDQHYKMIEDARLSIQRVGPSSQGFLGKDGTATSGIQEQTQVEQSNQRLAGLMDNFKEGRTMVGEQLLSMIIEDIGKEPKRVVIEGDAVQEPRLVLLNGPEIDPHTLMPYLSNDVQRTRLKVALEDVPTSSSFRAQQLAALSESIKSMPPDMQKAVMPFMVALMDLPHKKEVIQAIRAASQQESPEGIEARIKQGIADGVKAAGLDVKSRELDLKYNPKMLDMQIRKIAAEVFNLNTTGQFQAIETATTLMMNPAAAPLADAVSQTSGFIPAPDGIDPNYGSAIAPAAALAAAPVPQLPNGMTPPPQPTGPDGQPADPTPGTRTNTSPLHPPTPQLPAPQSAKQGIETTRQDDGGTQVRGFKPQPKGQNTP